MTDPLSFQSESARHALPLLFTAQAQKEVVLNESLARIDALLHPSVEGRLAAPPPAPEEGQCWLVDSPATGHWLGHEGEIASFVSGSWLFQLPRAGMRCWSIDEGRWLRFEGGWIAPNRPNLPQGGTTVDAESRAAIAALINALTLAGIFPT
jgi:hypothetical protein